MIVYEGTKHEFLIDTYNDEIADKISNKVREKMHRNTSIDSAEYRSWMNSMQYMYRVLEDNEIPDDAGVAIEYNIPQTAKRVDFLISGYNENGQPNVVVIELKQWQEIREVEGPEALVQTVTGGALRTVVHPSYQAWSYVTLIRDYNSSVQRNYIELFPCAYLHNYREQGLHDPIIAPRYQTFIEEAPIFVKGQAEALRNFIKRAVVKGDNKELLYEIDNGKIRPSKSLQDSIVSMLAGNQEFVMIDEQKVVYEKILEVSRQCERDGKKRTVIVEGGPGTGKSVVAINLLAELTHDGQFVQYVSKNSAPRIVYQKKLNGKMQKSRIDVMFKGSGSYVDAPINSVSTILVDEAHRLNMKSGMFHNLGENQVKEVINAARCSVFFIDEDQKVTLADIGSSREIEQNAYFAGSEVIKMELQSQFRCNGSDGYLAWVDDVLDIRETANYSLDGIDYDLQIFDSPEEVRELIVAKNNENHRSRMLAGYCWEWNKKEQNNSDYHDIQIGDFGMSWNLGSSIFALDDTSINEIGCIHTSQGLEFDYVGLIIGDDLRFEDGKIVTDFTKRAKTDQSLKGIKSYTRKIQKRH